MRQPDIATGSGLVCFGASQDRCGPERPPVGRGAYRQPLLERGHLLRSIDGDKGSHLAITLTSDGTLVGTGTAAYVWATADWVETGDIADVQEYGDYMRIGREVPSTLQVEIPASDILGLISWLIGKVTDHGDPVNPDTGLLTDSFKRLTINHLERHFADRFIAFEDYSVVTSSQYTAAGFGSIDAGQLTNANPKIRAEGERGRSRGLHCRHDRWRAGGGLQGRRQLPAGPCPVGDE